MYSIANNQGSARLYSCLVSVSFVSYHDHLLKQWYFFLLDHSQKSWKKLKIIRSVSKNFWRVIRIQIFLRLLKIFLVIQNFKKLYHDFLGDTKFEKFVSRLLGWYKWYKYHFWRLDPVQFGCIEVAAMRRQWVASFSPHQARSPCQRLAKHSPRTQKDQTKVLERISADHQRHLPTRKKNFYD